MTADTKQERVQRLVEAARAMLAVLSRFGEWDDGCYYYNKTSSPELEDPIRDMREALAAFEEHES